jgi:hypothetical protein
MLSIQSFLMYIMQCVASILQRIYIRSLVCNIRLPFGKLHLQDLKGFNEAVQALQRDAPQVEEYISSIGYENFAFTRFPWPRFGYNTSNIVESTNLAWRDIRELPPLQLLNGIY